MFLDRDDLETHELGHASLSKFISTIVTAGAHFFPTSFGMPIASPLLC